jgi:hypothetical protein
MKTPFLLILSIALPLLANAADTNTFFVTDDGYLSSSSPEIKSAIYEASKTNQESMPACDFTEGNWGPVYGGFQLSLRFQKQTFTNGEPITAILLIRNVTNSSMYLHFDLFPVGYMDGPIGFRVLNDIGEPIPQHQYNAGVWSGGARCLATGTQAKFQESLDQRFDLSNGTYSVQAIRKALYLPSPNFENDQPVFQWSLQKEVEVKSAEVTIKIVSSK